MITAGKVKKVKKKHQKSIILSCEVVVSFSIKNLEKMAEINSFMEI